MVYVNEAGLEVFSNDLLFLPRSETRDPGALMDRGPGTPVGTGGLEATVVVMSAAIRADTADVALSCGIEDTEGSDRRFGRV